MLRGSLDVHLRHLDRAQGSSKGKRKTDTVNRIGIIVGFGDTNGTFHVRITNGECIALLVGAYDSTTNSNPTINGDFSKEFLSRNNSFDSHHSLQPEDCVAKRSLGESSPQHYAELRLRLRVVLKFEDVLAMFEPRWGGINGGGHFFMLRCQSA